MPAGEGDRKNTAQSRRRRYWWPLGVLALANLVDQFDQGVLRGVLPILEDYWDLSDFQLGLLGFAFIFMNVLATIPAGWIADRYRRNRIIGFTLLSWTGLVVIAATAVNYWHLLGARLGTGIGHAVDDPSATSLLSDYYPARQRGRVYSVQQVMLFVGTGIGLGLGGFIGSTLGWRWAFILICVPGSLAALLCFRLREPRRGEADDDVPPEAVHEHEKPTFADLGGFFAEAWRSLLSELRFIFGIRTMRYILVGAGTLLFTVSGVGYWLAVYHTRYSDMSVTQATAFTAGVLSLGGIVGTLGGGAIADRVYGRGPQGRISAAGWSILICTALFLVSYNVGYVPARLVVQFLGVVAISSAIPGLRASMMDVVPARSRGVSSSAFALASAVFGTALAPPILGLLSDLTSLLGAFYIASPPIVIGTLILMRARTTIQQDINQILEALMARQAETEETSQSPPAGEPPEGAPPRTEGDEHPGPPA